MYWFKVTALFKVKSQAYSISYITLETEQLKVELSGINGLSKVCTGINSMIVEDQKSRLQVQSCNRRDRATEG